MDTFLLTHNILILVISHFYYVDEHSRYLVLRYKSNVYVDEIFSSLSFYSTAQFSIGYGPRAVIIHETNLPRKTYILSA